MITLPNPKRTETSKPAVQCLPLPLSFALALNILLSLAHRGCCGSRRGTHARCGHVGADSPPAELRARKRCDEGRRGGCEDGQERESRETSHDVRG